MKNLTFLPILTAVLAACLACAGCDDDGTKAPPAPGSVAGTIAQVLPDTVLLGGGDPAASTGSGMGEGLAATATATVTPGMPGAPGMLGAPGALHETASITPVIDAFVTLVDAEDLTVATEIIQTDDQGAYRFDGLAPGEYAALVLHETLVVRERSAPAIRIKSNQVTTFDINMTPFELFSNRRFHVEGAVTDAVTGKPVAGAHVGTAIAINGELSAYIEGVGTLWATVTDSLGYYRVPALSITLPGGYGLVPITFTKEGYEPFTLIGEGPSIPGVIPPTLPQPTGDDLTLAADIELRPLSSGGTGPHGTGAVRGRLTSLGRPLAGILVGAHLSFVADPDTFRAPPASNVPVPGKTTRTDRAGDFLIEGLTPGDYWIDAAFSETDGYVLVPMSDPFAARCSVVSSQTCNVGDIELGRAISPENPPNRSTVQDTTPEFRWTEVSVPQEMTFVGYNIEFGAGYIMDSQRTNLMEPRWRMPESMAFAPGEHVRWDVVARAFNPASGDTVVIGGFEWPATFSVAE